MTLLMQVCVGKNDMNPFPFVIATADTRSVYRWFCAQTLEYDEKIIEKRNDSYDKVERVSNNVLLNTGGNHEVTEALKNYVLERAEDHYFLDDLEKILKDGYEYLKKTGDEVIKHFLDSPYIFVCFTGFFENGNAGRLFLFQGETYTQGVEQEENISMMFSPNEDISNNMNELLDFSKSPLLNQARNYVDIFCNHLVYVHSIIASQEVDTVSEICLVYLLQNVNGKMHYDFLEVDLTEQIKEVRGML